MKGLLWFRIAICLMFGLYFIISAISWYNQGVSSKVIITTFIVCGITMILEIGRLWRKELTK